MDWTGFVGTVFDDITTLLNNLLVFAVSGLPTSPFTFITQNSVVSKYIGSINYFIPISYMVSVLQVWCVAIAIFYIWQVLLRWAKAIQ
ncbi:MAG: hypothetical protein JJE17_12150 [Peptostreptococcaceae bacterium]|nr:hypothetical protein [Peptostreptococcaceae bacterium]